jgi:cell division protein FtsB
VEERRKHVAEERSRGRGERGRSPGKRRSGSAAPGRARREPQLTHTRSRAGSVVAATTGLLGLSSTRRAAVLALVVCALALTVVVPLRNYVAQRQELAAVTAQQRSLTTEVDELTQERARLSDPEEIAAQARSRLGYVRPGEVPYVVQLPSTGRDASADPATDGMPWYRQLWREVENGPAGVEPVR